MTHTPFPRLVEERARELKEKDDLLLANAKFDSQFNYITFEECPKHIQEYYLSAGHKNIILEYAAKHPAAVAALVEGTACVLPVDPTETMIKEGKTFQGQEVYTDEVINIYNDMRAAGRLDKEGTACGMPLEDHSNSALIKLLREQAQTLRRIMPIEKTDYGNGTPFTYPLCANLMIEAANALDGLMTSRLDKEKT